MDLIGQIKFVLYKESERDRWRIQVSSSSSTEFINFICSIILVRSSSYRIIYKQVLLRNDYVVSIQSYCYSTFHGLVSTLKNNGYSIRSI